MEGLAGDVASLGAGEIDGGGGDVLSLAHLPGGDRGQNFLFLFVGQGIRHRAGDKAGGDAIHRHITRRHFLRQRFCQANQARFGRGIIRLPRIARHADDRGDVDNAPAPPQHHTL